MKAIDLCKYLLNRWRESGKNFDEGCWHMNSNIFFELAANDMIEYPGTEKTSFPGAARIFDMVIIVDDSVNGVEIQEL